METKLLIAKNKVKENLYTSIEGLKDLSEYDLSYTYYTPTKSKIPAKPKIDGTVYALDNKENKIVAIRQNKDTDNTYKLLILNELTDFEIINKKLDFKVSNIYKTLLTITVLSYIGSIASLFILPPVAAIILACGIIFNALCVITNKTELNEYYNKKIIQLLINKKE